MAFPHQALVGRGRELSDVSNLLSNRDSDRTALVVLTGPASIGKTALADRIAGDFHGRVLCALATPWERSDAGGVLRQLLPSVSGTETPGDPLTAAARLLERISSQPTLLLVDDAECADDLSLQALSTLARQHRARPVGVLLAARESDALLRLGGTTIRLDGLGTAGVTELAAAHDRVLSPAVAVALRRHTAGNPGHVIALLHEVPATQWARLGDELPAPASVVADVERRLSACSADTGSLIAAAAVLHEGADLADLAALARLADPSAALDEAYAAHLLAPGPALPSPLVRAAVRAVQGRVAVAGLHRRAADLARDPAHRLLHLVAATPTLDAALADEVGQRAHVCAEQGAWSTAARLWWEAARLTPDGLLRDGRVTRAMDAQVGAGDAVGAVELVPLLESLRETPSRDAVLGYLAVLRGRASDAERWLHRAWDIANPDRDPRTAGLIAGRYVLDALARCDGAGMVAWADRAVRLAGPDTPEGLEAAAIRGLGIAATGDLPAARTAYVELTERVPHGAQSQRVSMGLGWLDLLLDDVEEARVRLESAMSTELLGGSARIALWSAGWLARAYVLLGDWDQALWTVERGRHLVRGSGIVLIASLLEWTAAQVHALRGDWGQADAAVRAADSAGAAYPVMTVPARIARAQVAEARSDYAAVVAALEPLRATPPAASVAASGLWPWTDLLANALIVEGRHDEADAFLQPHETWARAHGLRSARARLGYARGRLHGATGNLPAARACFEEALRTLESLPLRYDLARVRFAYGQTLRRAGKRRAADQMLSLARDAYLSLGARTYVERCDRELRASGSDRQRGGRAPDALTPHEDSVAELVAAGLSNREVAEKLFVSPKTVQYHLTRIYTKLGVRTRVELAAVHRTPKENP